MCSIFLLSGLNRLFILLVDVVCNYEALYANLEEIKLENQIQMWVIADQALESAS